MAENVFKTPEEFAIENPNVIKRVAQAEQEGRLPYAFDPQNIVESTIAGGAIGAVLGATPIGRAVTMAGKVGSSLMMGAEGAATAGISSTAAEAIKASEGDRGVNEALALGAELALGLTPSLAKDFVYRLPAAAIQATGLPYSIAKTIQAIPGMGESQSSKLAKISIFGTKYAEPSVGLTKNYVDEVQKQSKYVSGLIGSKLPEAVEPSIALRQYMTKLVDNRQLPPLRESTEFKSLLNELPSLIKDRVITSADAMNIKAALLRQGTKNESKKGTFNTLEAMIKENKTPLDDDVNFLSPNASEYVRTAMDKYFQSRTGKPLYGELKELETNIYTAKARDDLPKLLAAGFSGQLTEKALSNVRRSPKAQEELKVALASYIRGRPEGDIASEWASKLYPILEQSKALPKAELDALGKKIDIYTKKGLLSKGADIGKNAVKKAVVYSLVPNEIANEIFKSEGQTPYSL